MVPLHGNNRAQRVMALSTTPVTLVMAHAVAADDAARFCCVAHDCERCTLLGFGVVPGRKLRVAVGSVRIWALIINVSLGLVDC